MDALPRSDAAEPVPAPPPQAGERGLAGWFFGAAILIAILDIPIALWRTYRAPDPLVIAALVAASAAMLADFTLSRTEAAAPRLSIVKRMLESDGWCAIAVGVMFLAFYGATIARPTPYNSHTRLAWALLHGHLWINAPAYMEHVVVNGHSYILHPPMSAILMLPAVAIWGRAANQTAVAVVLGAISLALAWRLMGRLGLSTTAKIWLIAFFGIGTTFWYEATLGASWDFVLVASVPFTLAALCEVFGDARPLWVGLWAALAALARYDLVLAWPVYALMLVVRKRRWRELLWMLPGFAGALLIYVAYNEARFGTPNDIAMWLWYAHDKYRFQRPGGPIALSHVPFNLYTLLFMAPAYSGRFPWIRPQFMGQALLLISPAFVLALRPSFAKPRAAFVLLAALLTSGPSMLWYANGFAQLGPRYYVQVYPFLLALIAMGIGERAKPDQLTKILIVVSIAFVVFFTWQARWYGWRT